MNDIWTNWLSEYLDGELENDARAALEAHLATCGQCYATLGELRQVVARAKALEDRPPTKNLWFGIAQQIRRDAVVDRPAPSLRPGQAVRPSARRLSLT